MSSSKNSSLDFTAFANSSSCSLSLERRSHWAWTDCVFERTFSCCSFRLSYCARASSHWPMMASSDAEWPLRSSAYSRNLLSETERYMASTSANHL